MDKIDFDYIVIGSGFGGSVSAMRLSQKGYRVAVIETGKRWYPSDFPVTNMRIHDYLWLPRLFLRGFQKITLLNGVMALTGVGVGGGSLVYAGSLHIPEDIFFENDIIKNMGGKKYLLPYYKVARQMLGVEINPRTGIADKLLRRVASEFGAEHTFKSSPSGIFFGEENKTVLDPYFKGEGPKRTGCNFCGGCMVGCRYNAKNSLDKNYLYFAEKLGATVIPETEVTHVIPVGENGADGYIVKTQKSTSFMGAPRRNYTAKGVIFAAGTLGTIKLLLKMKRSYILKNLSPALGVQVRTNSESILGVEFKHNKNIDLSNRIAISSLVQPEPDTSIEAVGYSRGSNLMGFFATVFTDGEGFIPRPIKFLFKIIIHPWGFLKTFMPFGFATRTLILLVMQTRENYFRLDLQRSLLFPLSFKIVSRRGTAKKIPAYIPVGYEFAKRLARRTSGTPKSALTEALLDSPVSAHILGGCTIAENRREGVIDYKNHVFGYQNMLVCDGSTIPANPGINPSLSITAFAERAMSFIPIKQDKTPHIFRFEKKWESAGWIHGKE